jgi:cysteinyl-tRNA synthetase
MNMALRVYNTLTRQKEPFQTVQTGKVGMYVCGPTVYKPSHVGHMVGPVIFDAVKRYLTYLGYKVTWIVNITDVDDKLIVRARELATTVKELAEKMTSDYVDCLKKLNVTGIDSMPKATDHIPEMVKIMEALIAKDYAYAAGGDVYFDITKDADYGKLCHRDPEQMEAGSRVEVSEKKRNPGDFALWKGSKPGEPAWPSPWGPGRPGWHIECSAMSMKYLGETLDIHGGGLDLQFPHHENELAQSESYTGKTFARYWMHNGLLKMGTAKMAGSVGNVVNVVDLLKQHAPETVRFLLLGTHYRSPIEWSEDRLGEVKRSLEGFYRFFERFLRISGEQFRTLTREFSENGFEHVYRRVGIEAHGRVNDVGEKMIGFKQLRESFLEHMNDDFNTGGAIGSMYELLTRLNRFADLYRLETVESNANAKEAFDQGVLALKQMSQILGLFELEQNKQSTGDNQLTNGLMQLLIDLREEARKTKNFAMADQIRKRLGDLGVIMEDRPGGTGWRVS